MRRWWREMDFFAMENKIIKKLTNKFSKITAFFIFNIFILSFIPACFAIEESVIFVVNLESGTVICQHSSDSSDVHLHDISVLCDGKLDCYRNSRIHDESFPYCASDCNSKPSSNLFSTMEPIKCHGNGACLNDGHKSRCFCNSGSFGVDCAENSNDSNQCSHMKCHDLAKCKHTNGFYKCECPSGFEGDGQNCFDIDECASIFENNVSKCPLYSKCQNLPGSFLCHCTSGFEPVKERDPFSRIGSGVLNECVDIDECSNGNYNCPDSATKCQNTLGGYLCVDECGGGYELAYVNFKAQCIDIDECSRSKLACDRRATCHNTLGGYECQCEKGFAGNGNNCYPIQDCTQDSTICDRHATCDPSFKLCICDSGYAGDGIECADLNECTSSNENPCSGSSNPDQLSLGSGASRCLNIEGGYICCDSEKDDDECIRDQGAFCAGGCGDEALCYNNACQCASGYWGDPKTKCYDIDECLENAFGACSVTGQWCINLPGSHLCCSAESKEIECLDRQLKKPFQINFSVDAELKSVNNASANAEAVAQSFARARVHGRKSNRATALRGPETASSEIGNEAENSAANEINEIAAQAERKRSKTVHKIQKEHIISGGYVLLTKYGSFGKSGSVKGANSNLESYTEPKKCNPLIQTSGTGYECPDNSHCHQGLCKCIIGFGWNGASLSCEDVNECEFETNPCHVAIQNETDINGCIEEESWCVNTIGSFRCCSTKNTIEGVLECAGIKVVPINREPPHKGDISKNKKQIHSEDKEFEDGNLTIGVQKKGRWRTITYGEWKSFSGGEFILQRGKGRVQNVSRFVGTKLEDLNLKNLNNKTLELEIVTYPPDDGETETFHLNNQTLRVERENSTTQRFNLIDKSGLTKKESEPFDLFTEAPFGLEIIGSDIAKKIPQNKIEEVDRKVSTKLEKTSNNKLQEQGPNKKNTFELKSNFTETDSSERPFGIEITRLKTGNKKPEEKKIFIPIQEFEKKGERTSQQKPYDSKENSKENESLKNRHGLEIVGSNIANGSIYEITSTESPLTQFFSTLPDELGLEISFRKNLTTSNVQISNNVFNEFTTKFTSENNQKNLSGSVNKNLINTTINSIATPEVGNFEKVNKKITIEDFSTRSSLEVDNTTIKNPNSNETEERSLEISFKKPVRNESIKSTSILNPKEVIGNSTKFLKEVSLLTLNSNNLETTTFFPQTIKENSLKKESIVSLSSTPTKLDGEEKSKGNIRLNSSTTKENSELTSKIIKSSAIKTTPKLIKEIILSTTNTPTILSEKKLFKITEFPRNEEKTSIEETNLKTSTAEFIDKNILLTTNSPTISTISFSPSLSTQKINAEEIETNKTKETTKNGQELFEYRVQIIKPNKTKNRNISTILIKENLLSTTKFNLIPEEYTVRSNPKSIDFTQISENKTINTSTSTPLVNTLQSNIEKKTTKENEDKNLNLLTGLSFTQTSPKILTVTFSGIPNINEESTSKSNEILTTTASIQTTSNPKILNNNKTPKAEEIIKLQIVTIKPFTLNKTKIIASEPISISNQKTTMKYLNTVSNHEEIITTTNSQTNLYTSKKPKIFNITTTSIRNLTDKYLPTKNSSTDYTKLQWNGVSTTESTNSREVKEPTIGLEENLVGLEIGPDAIKDSHTKTPHIGLEIGKVFPSEESFGNKEPENKVGEIKKESLEISGKGLQNGEPLQPGLEISGKNLLTSTTIELPINIIDESEKPEGISNEEWEKIKLSKKSSSKVSPESETNKLSVSSTTSGFGLEIVGEDINRHASEKSSKTLRENIKSTTKSIIIDEEEPSETTDSEDTNNRQTSTISEVGIEIVRVTIPQIETASKLSTLNSFESFSATPEPTSKDTGKIEAHISSTLTEVEDFTSTYPSEPYTTTIRSTSTPPVTDSAVNAIKSTTPFEISSEGIYSTESKSDVTKEFTDTYARTQNLQTISILSSSSPSDIFENPSTIVVLSSSPATDNKSRINSTISTNSPEKSFSETDRTAGITLNPTNNPDKKNILGSTIKNQQPESKLKILTTESGPINLESTTILHTQEVSETPSLTNFTFAPKINSGESTTAKEMTKESSENFPIDNNSSSILYTTTFTRITDGDKIEGISLDSTTKQPSPLQRNITELISKSTTTKENGSSESNKILSTTSPAKQTDKQSKSTIENNLIGTSSQKLLINIGTTILPTNPKDKIKQIVSSTISTYKTDNKIISTVQISNKLSSTFPLTKQQKSITQAPTIDLKKGTTGNKDIVNEAITNPTLKILSTIGNTETLETSKFTSSPLKTTTNKVNFRTTLSPGVSSLKHDLTTPETTTIHENVSSTNKIIEETTESVKTASTPEIIKSSTINSTEGFYSESSTRATQTVSVTESSTNLKEDSSTRRISSILNSSSKNISSSTEKSNPTTKEFLNENSSPNKPKNTPSVNISLSLKPDDKLDISTTSNESSSFSTNNYYSTTFEQTTSHSLTSSSPILNEKETPLRPISTGKPNLLKSTTNSNAIVLIDSGEEPENLSPEEKLKRISSSTTQSNIPVFSSSPATIEVNIKSESTSTTSPIGENNNSTTKELSTTNLPKEDTQKVTTNLPTKVTNLPSEKTNSSEKTTKLQNKLPESSPLSDFPKTLPPSVPESSQKLPDTTILQKASTKTTKVKSKEVSLPSFPGSLQTTSKPLQKLVEDSKSTSSQPSSLPSSHLSDFPRTLPPSVPESSQKLLASSSEASTKAAAADESTEATAQTLSESPNPLATLSPMESSSLPQNHCVSSDECGLDSYCERRTGACRCLPGFNGAPPQIPCSDVDECDLKIDSCHSSSYCQNYVGGYACNCAIGYRKNIKEGICEDINECLEQNGTLCHSAAKCINLAGSYLCQCQDGYTGDGYHCHPIEARPCTRSEWMASDCGRNHVCLVWPNNVGNGAVVDCERCKHGFRQRNGVCSDINECIESRQSLYASGCHNDAICQNTVGGYQCTCKIGYRGDGFHCYDVNECDNDRTAHAMGCHPQAECHNLPGSYRCECPPGWRGDGITQCWNPEDAQCQYPAAVCPHAEDFTSTACLSVRVGADWQLKSICECRSGYRYTQNSTFAGCVEIDECAEERHNCNALTSYCLKRLGGGYTCECHPGYEGNGDGICSDIDECRRKISDCHPNAHCINKIGNFECRCAPGYTGNGKECTEIIETTSTKSFGLKKTPKIGEFVGNVNRKACTEEWNSMCRAKNQTCHYDDEDVPQCGSCLYGYQPMNGKCHPINEIGNCAESTQNNCHKNAECIDIYPGRHFCACKNGFIGDGIRCDDVDECSIPGLCDSHASCKNLNGTFECRCNDGYRGDGFKCSEISTTISTDLPKIKSTIQPQQPRILDCRENPRICHPNAQCLWNRCECYYGFKGDGIRECRKPNRVSMSPSSPNTLANYSTTHLVGISSTQKPFSTNNLISTTTTRNNLMANLYTGRASLFEQPKGILTTSTTPKSWFNNGNLPLNHGNSLPPARNNSHVPLWPTTPFSVPTLRNKVAPVNVRASENLLATTPANNGPLLENTITNRNRLGTIPTEIPNTLANEINSIDGKRCGVAICHPLATCNAQQSVCVCNQGFEGDGYYSCEPSLAGCNPHINNTFSNNNNSYLTKPPYTFPAIICHSNAFCDSESRQCKCRSGFLGDGVQRCEADRWDCAARGSSLCSVFADCIGKRCRCHAGYTGDGFTCMQLQPDGADDCLACHCKARCIGSTPTQRQCVCEQGYVGNGLLCLPDPEDCLNYPNICAQNAKCDRQTRKCACSTGFFGQNGINCRSKESCLQNTRLCHSDAQCLPNGECQCLSGFQGDGRYKCTKSISPTYLIGKPETIEFFECSKNCGRNSECVKGACKCLDGYAANQNGICQDIDECRVGAAACAVDARCHNQEGGYKCECPDGMLGDGRSCYPYTAVGNDYAVQCLSDGIRLYLDRESSEPAANKPFRGLVFVKGQNGNPYCSKNFSGSETVDYSHKNSLFFHIPIAHCDVDLEANNTLAVTVIVQRHSTFLTEQAYAYALRCHYPTPLRSTHSHFYVNELLPSELAIGGRGPEPQCHLNVMDIDDGQVAAATVGQALKLSLTIQPNKTYAILPRNCFAINMDSGERYALTDSAGCSVDPDIFPEWTRVRPYLAQAMFRTFKWPDASMIRFECDCSACFAMCPTVNCARRRRESIQTKLRFTRQSPDKLLTSDDANVLDGDTASLLENERDPLVLRILKNLSTTSTKMSFSPVLNIQEDSNNFGETQTALKQLERWRFPGIESKQGIEENSENFIEDSKALPLTERVCVSGIWLAFVAILLILITAIMAFLLVERYRKYRDMRELRRRNGRCLYDEQDNRSSYINF